MWVSQEPDPAFSNRKLCHCTSKGEGFPWEPPMRSYWAVPNKALKRNTVSPLCKLWNRTATHFPNRITWSIYYATMPLHRWWKHMDDEFFVLWHEIGKSTKHCILSFFLAEVKHVGEVCLVHLFTGQQGHIFSVLCTFWCFPVGGRSARSERWLALSVIFFASCPQGPLMALSEGLHLLTRSSSQQTDSSLLLCLGILASACYLHFHTKAW